MGYTFEVTKVRKVDNAQIGILDGRILEGRVRADSSALLLHDGQSIPVHVKGVLLCGGDRSDGLLSLTVGLGERAMKLVAAGDKIRA
ncbi:hypothetical protein [Duganella sp. BJB476]|uniref:hypothetical protein n=1 Tax=Duganella sp. BJB476 TaxID=1871176 RepID=UPI0011C10B0A|nr:hypothetical protein [Duganella sp. BJB476]